MGQAEHLADLAQRGAALDGGDDGVAQHALAPLAAFLLQLLASHPRTVSEIAAEFTVTRSAISQHLLLLAEVGLVDAEKVGRQRIYRVRASGLRQLQAEIDRFWTDELDLLVADAHALQPQRNERER